GNGILDTTPTPETCDGGMKACPEINGIYMFGMAPCIATCDGYDENYCKMSADCEGYPDYLSGADFNLCYFKGNYVPDTAQGQCYDNSAEMGAGCPAPGADFFGQDAQYGGSGKYISMVVTDVVGDDYTGLQWHQMVPQLYSDCNSEMYCTWAQAVTYCENSMSGGYSDWRLPTDKELESIIEYSGIVPMVPEGVFTMFDAEYFWSSTENVANPTMSAWATYFAIGTSQPAPKTSQYKAICVRGTFFPTDTKTFTHEWRGGDEVYLDDQTGLMWTGDYWYSDVVPVSDWTEALAYCETGEFAGYTDWRLPSINELGTTYDRTWATPPADFPGFSSYAFWSSTSRPDAPTAAYYLTSGGSTGSQVKTLSGAVRCVR
ncbi:MAG TPA: DUF1566 domain-containing protein, partial [bacterium]|nr:DUF1566 domain-containing protein [bacterium]